MNPLLQRLAVVRRRYWMVTVLSGVFAVAAFAIGLAVVVGLIDYANHLPRLLRAGALVSLLGGAGFLIFNLLAYPLAKKSDNLSLALRIEAMHPELNDALASTIQFLEQPNTTAGGDPRLREIAIQKATKQAASFDFHAILDYRFLGFATLGLISAIAAGAHFLYHERDLSRTALLRLADPFGDHPWTEIRVPDAQTRIAVGQPFRLAAEVKGVLPPNVKIDIEAKSPFSKTFERRPEMILPVKLGADKRLATVSTPLDVSQKPLEFRYRIRGNDGSFPPRGQWHTVQVLQPPSFAELDGHPSPQIELRIPRYTGLRTPVKLSPGTRHIDVIQGTEILFTAAVDRPLKSATIELKPVDTAVRTASYLGLVSPTALLPQISSLAALRTFPWSIPAQLDESRTKLSARFRPLLAGSYALHLVDDNDLIRVYEADLRVLVDPLPKVQLRRPAISQSYLPKAEVPLHVQAEDDLFAVRNVGVEYRVRTPKKDQGDWTEAAVATMPLYDPAAYGQLLRALVKAPIPFEEISPVRQQRVNLNSKWRLRNQFKPGDVIVIQATADDFCDVFSSRGVSRSSEVEIRIVSDDELARQLDADLGDVQKELAALKKMEDEAQKLLEEIPKEKQDAKALDQAVEAAQKVKQVHERIGQTKDEGLRDKLEKIQQTIKDNKLPNSEVQDQAKAMSQELERLAQDEFPKLEQNLNDLRKELSGASKSKDDGKKNPLEKSKDANKEIQKTISELSRSLDRWADLAQLKGQTRELLEKQRDLSKKSDDLKTQQELAKGNPKAMRELQDDAKKLAGEQKKLERETKDLLDKINDVRKQQDENARKEAEAAEDDKDAKQRADEAKDAAAKLRKAQNRAKTDELNQQMNAAADDLKSGKTNSAKEKQQQAGKTLEGMAKDLEGEKDDDIDRLRKKQKEAQAAQNELDKLKKNVDKLQQGQKAAANNKEAQKQQAEDLREAADQLRDNARQLQRLQEPKAARELQRAAEKLDEAAKKMEAGEAAEAEQLEQEAREHIERAQQQLEHLQQELAREQLAQIGDRLKGLKERQDAALDESKELQKTIDAQKKWTRGLVDRLNGQQQTQAGLAKETQSLEEKLKGALVFEHILKKAGKAMDQAADSMSQRRDVAKQRLLPEPDPAEQKKREADETKRFEETLKLQKLAADRLDRLLDALKDTPPQMAKKDKKDPPKKNAEGQEPKEPKEPEGGMRAGDGIPPMAQLKALKAEQVEVFERTKEFSRDNPDLANLDEARQRELRELTEEQGRLRQLFEQMTNRKEGDMP
jgi:hypothetical protein